MPVRVCTDAALTEDHFCQLRIVNERYYALLEVAVSAHLLGREHHLFKNRGTTLHQPSTSLNDTARRLRST